MSVMSKNFYASGVPTMRRSTVVQVSTRQQPRTSAGVFPVVVKRVAPRPPVKLTRSQLVARAASRLSRAELRMV